MNSQEKPNFPVSSSYIPFLPSPEFLRTHKDPTTVKEYVPQPVTKGEMTRYVNVPTPKYSLSKVDHCMKKQMTKYGHVPNPTNRPSEAEDLVKKQKQEQPPKGSAPTQNRKKRRLRQLQKPMHASVSGDKDLWRWKDNGMERWRRNNPTELEHSYNLVSHLFNLV